MNRVKNNRAFTLVEILAVIVIIGILSGTAVVGVSKNITKSHEEFCTSQADMLTIAGKDYYNDHLTLLPISIGKEDCVTLETLIKDKYLKENEMKDYNKTACNITNTKVCAIKNTKTSFYYTNFLDCGACNVNSDVSDKKSTPKIEFSPNGANNTLNKDITIKMRITDDKYPIISYAYKIYQVTNSGDIEVSSVDFREYKGNDIKIKLNRKGTFYIKGYAYNSVGGYKEQKSNNYNLKYNLGSKCAGGIEITAKKTDNGTTSTLNPKEWTKGSVDITVKRKGDVESYDIYIATMNAPYGSSPNYVKTIAKATATSRKISYDNTKTGKYSVYIVAYNDQGDTCETVKGEYDFYQDNTDPSCETLGAPGKWVNHSVTLTPKCSDADSGCDNSKSGKNVINREFNDFATPGRVYDMVGNYTMCPSVLVQIDFHAPRCIFIPNGVKGLNGYYKSSPITLSVVAYDDTGFANSGVASYGFSKVTLSEGPAIVSDLENTTSTLFNDNPSYDAYDLFPTPAEIFGHSDVIESDPQKARYHTDGSSHQIETISENTGPPTNTGKRACYACDIAGNCSSNESAYSPETLKMAMETESIGHFIYAPRENDVNIHVIRNLFIYKLDTVPPTYEVEMRGSSVGGGYADGTEIIIHCKDVGSGPGHADPKWTLLKNGGGYSGIRGHCIDVAGNVSNDYDVQMKWCQNPTCGIDHYETCRCKYNPCYDREITYDSKGKMHVGACIGGYDWCYNDSRCPAVYKSCWVDYDNGQCRDTAVYRPAPAPAPEPEDPDEPEEEEPVAPTPPSTTSKKDRTNPVCGAKTGGNREWKKSGSVKVCVECKDNESGCRQNKYCTTYSKEAKSTIVPIDIYDNAGNKTTCNKNYDIYIDKTAPELRKGEVMNLTNKSVSEIIHECGSGTDASKQKIKVPGNVIEKLSGLDKSKSYYYIGSTSAVAEYRQTALPDRYTNNSRDFNTKDYMHDSFCSTTSTVYVKYHLCDKAGNCRSGTFPNAAK